MTWGSKIESDYVRIGMQIGEVAFSIHHDIYEIMVKATNISGVDPVRLSQLWNLVLQSAKLSEGDIIEVGCFKGGSGYVIAKAAQSMELPSEVILCDTFAGLVKSGEDDRLANGTNKGATKEGVEAFMRENGANAVVMEGVFPEAMPDLESRSFRFAHIDVDTYQSAKDAFGFIWPRMEIGGIVVMDDYGEQNCPGITKLVHELSGLPDAIWQTHIRFQAVAVKI